MDLDEKLDIISNKVKTAKLLKVFEIFCASVLTVIGTISITSLLMFLNASFGVSYFMCLVMTFILSNIYSFIVNESLHGLDNKIKKMRLEIELLQKEYDVEKEWEQFIKEIELRFDGLSKENKLKLLNYIKGNVTYVDDFKEIKLFAPENIDELIKEFDNIDSIELTGENLSGYTRKRNKKDCM